MFVVKRSVVSAPQKDDFSFGLWSIDSREEVFFSLFFFFNRREKKVISGQRWSSLSPGISMRWGTSHLVLCKFLNLLFIYLFLIVVIIFYLHWFFKEHGIIQLWVFWCCVREILCKTRIKGSLEIRHRLFIKIYVYVFRL